MTTKLATVEEVADATAGVPDGVAVPGSGAAVVAAAVVVAVLVHTPEVSAYPVEHVTATLLVESVHVTVAAPMTAVQVEHAPAFPPNSPAVHAPQTASAVLVARV